MRKLLFLLISLFSVSSLYAGVPPARIVAGGLRAEAKAVSSLSKLRYTGVKVSSGMWRVPMTVSVAAPAAPVPAFVKNSVVPTVIARRAMVSSRLHQARLGKLFPGASLARTEQHIRQSTVDIRGQATDEFMGSGFVFQAASGRLYAIGSYHVAGRAGNRVKVRMYGRDGKALDYPGAVVSGSGSYGFNAPDAVVIALPSWAGQDVRPLRLAGTKPAEGTELVSWGTPYDSEQLGRIGNLKVKNAQGFKITMSHEDASLAWNGMCGSPVLDAQGEVVGVYSGHDEVEELVFAVDARRTLLPMIAAYEKGEVFSYEYNVFGKTAFELVAGETIGWVRHVDSQGSLVKRVYLPIYTQPFDPYFTEKLFEEARPGDTLAFEVMQHRIVTRTEYYVIP